MNAPAQKPPMLQGTPLPYRAQLIQRAASRIPLTAEGIPVGYYRTDLLPQAYVKPEEEAQILRGAFADLSFEYGYPTQSDGRPFWHKLDFEPPFAFGCFEAYLELLNEGPRELAKLAGNGELQQIARRMLGVPEEENFHPDTLQRMLYEYSILYYWRPRAKAHDLYKEAAFRHTRLRRQMSVEDEHYGLATRLLRELQEKVLGTPRFFEEMHPRVAADLLTKLVSIQRVSVGLPANGPLAQKETPTDTTFEMIMRTLGQRASQGNVFDQSGNQEASREALQEVLSDSDTAHKLQEVIIRISKKTQESSHLGNPFAGRTFKSRNRTEHPINSDDLNPEFDITGAPGEQLGDM